MLRISALVLLLASTASAQAGMPRCDAVQGRQAAPMAGQLSRGETFTQRAPGGWVLRLAPTEAGWFLEVGREDRGAEDLARLTPPWHFVPNHREIYGWHFRNAANTGPNDGSVNAPRELREFIFSPLARLTPEGRDIQGADAKSKPTSDEIDAVRSFGRGWFYIHSYTLTPVRQGERAAFESLRFSACLTWPG